MKRVPGMAVAGWLLAAAPLAAGEPGDEGVAALVGSFFREESAAKRRSIAAAFAGIHPSLAAPWLSTRWRCWRTCGGGRTLAQVTQLKKF